MWTSCRNWKTPSSVQNCHEGNEKLNITYCDTNCSFCHLPIFEERNVSISCLRMLFNDAFQFFIHIRRNFRSIGLGNLNLKKFSNPNNHHISKRITVFENHRKSRIWHCERSELRLQKLIRNTKNGQFLASLRKQCYQTGHFR